MTVPAYDIAGGSDAAGALRSDFLNFAATLIQSAFRGYVQRKSFTALVCIVYQLQQLCDFVIGMPVRSLRHVWILWPQLPNWTHLARGPSP